MARSMTIRIPKTKTLLQGVILVLVLIIGVQVLDLNGSSCQDSSANYANDHHGLPWDQEISNQKRSALGLRGGDSPQIGIVNPEQQSNFSSNVTQHTRRRSSKRKTTFVKGKRRNPSRPKCFKQVQIWSREYTLWKQGEYSCPGLPCGIRQYTSTNYKTLKDSDAVVLWHETMWNWEEMHKNRPPGQKWILTSRESPINTRRNIIPPFRYQKNSYNYIMTYHVHETDFYGSFGFYDANKPTVPANDTRNWAAGRKNVVAWAARNCNNSYIKWKRQDFVRGLSEMVGVNMYGKCGDKSCPRNEKVCDDLLRTHKFYLSLENSNCRNYITEKFWKMAYSYDLLPIVYGPPRADYEAVAPPNSFIHVDDFNSLKELADYIDLLDMNDDRYNVYFAWKKKGSVHVTPPEWLFQPEQMCQVVERLLEDEQAEANKNYTAPALPDWNSWWFQSCKTIGDFPIIMN